MKRILISLTAFFGVQLFAALAASLYRMADKDAMSLDEQFIIATGIALLIGNAVLITAMALWLRHSEKPKASTSQIHYRSVTLAVSSLLLLALAETLLLAPLELSDPETERIFTLMASSPWCLLGLCIVGPVAEELVFRWGVQGALQQKGLKPWVCIATSSVCFAAVHANLMQMVPAFMSGLLLGYMFWRSGSVLPAVAAHIFNNTLAVASLSYPTAEEALTAQPLALLFVEGIVLLTASIFVATKIPCHENRNH